MDLTPIPVGTDTQVNTYTDDVQLYSTVAALADGGFVVIWYNQKVGGTGFGAYGQRYDTDGSAVGDEFHVNTGTSNTGSLPSVASLAGGGFVVTWIAWQQVGDSSALGIFARQFDADGNSIADDFCVNSFTANSQTHAAVTGLADGGYVVTWMSEGQDGSGYGIFAQRYAADGTATGEEFPVNTTVTGEQQIPEVTTVADGGFIISWCGKGTGDNNGVFAQRYAADGSPAGEEFRINSTVDGYQFYQAITSLADGGFVATWQSGDSGSYDVLGQRFDTQGNPTGSEFLVNTFTDGDQVSPQVTSADDGGFVVTWSSAGQDGSSYGVYGQRFSADGTPLGDEFRLNAITNGTQFSDGNSGGVSLITLQDGKIVQVWSGSGAAAPENVFFRMIDVPDAPVILSVTDNVPLYTGALTNGALTNDADLTVRVSLDNTSAAVGDTIQLYAGSGIDDPLGIAYVITAEDIINNLADVQTGVLVDGNYTLTAQITDALGSESVVSTNSFSVAVDATAPAILSNGGGSTAAVEVQENTAHVTNVLATDADPAEIIAFSISGGEDASLFQIVDGALSFVAAPDFEALPDDGATSGYQVTVQAIDDAGNVDSQEIKVNVTNVAGLTITATNRGQTLTGGGEEDLLQGGAGKDILIGLGGNDTIQGGAGTDVLIGSGGNDTLRGGVGTDILQGGAGHDWLDGGMGFDILTGGNGEDTFAFTAALAKANLDVISDFVVVDDTIALAASVFKNIGVAGAALDASQFCIGAKAQDATDRIIYNDATGALYYDVDGRGGHSAIQFATLTAGLALTEHDFLIV